MDFQLKQIQRCKTIDAIEYELNNLPKGLTERYDRIMSQIEDNSFLDSQMAKRVLKWVMSAPEPLETEAITCAARINIQNDNIDLKSEMSSESLLAICENLLMIDSEGRWRFFHLSVREYLKEKQEFKHEAYLFCAKVCFLSLMKTFESPLSSSDSLESLEASQATKSPFDPAGCFALHLQTCWPFYASDLRRTDGAFAFLKKFLGSPNESSVFFVRWSDYLFGQGHMTSVVFRLGLSKTLYVISPEITPNKTPLFAIVKFSLYEAFCDASQDEDYNMLLRNDRGKTLLVMAADVDCIKICEVLITRLLSTNECYVQRDLKVVLASAARNGRLDVVKRLVEEAHADVNLNSENEYHGESLSDAAPKGGVEIVRYLMEKVQADVDLPLNSGAWGSVLISATLQGKLDVVRYLVEEAHADVNFVNVVFYLGGCGSVLAAASSRGNLKIVRYLVEEAHADVNLALQFGDYGSALAAAACQGSLDIVQYLVEQAHADVNLPLQCGDYGSALVAASVCGEMDIMEYLVTAGADVNLPLQSGGYGSALAAAAAAFHRGLEIVQYLVEEAHADVNLTLQCGEYGSALAAAAYQLGSLDIVRYLVEEAHAELNLPLADWSYANALAVAKLTEGNADVVEYLEGKADSESSLS